MPRLSENITRISNRISNSQFVKKSEVVITEAKSVYAKYANIITIVSIVISVIFLILKFVAFASTFSVFQNEDTETELLNFGLDSTESAALLNRKIIPPENTQIPFDFIRYM